MRMAVAGWLPRGKSLPIEVWAQRHSRIVVLLWLHVPAILVYGIVQGVGLLHAMVEASAVAILGGAAVHLRSSRRLSTIAAAMGLLTSSAVLVHLSGGLIEMHFHYFVMVGVVTLYQDWEPFLIAIGYVVFQHGLAGAISPGSVYNHQSAIDHPWQWAGVHGLFVLGMSAAGIASWRFNEVLLSDSVDREERLVEAQTVARLGSWDWDLATNKVVSSDEFLRLLDRDVARGTASPEMFLARVHPDDRALAEREMKHLVELGVASAHDLRMIRPDGAVRWVHVRGQVTAWDGERPTAVAGTMQDVSDRKEAERSLSDTLSLLSATLDATADGILVVDRTGHITSFNRRFAEMWSIPDEVLASRDDDRTIAHVASQLSDPDSFIAKVRELYAQPEAESYDVIEFLDGKVFERTSKPQHVGTETVGRVWSFSDVTERKRLENELSHQAFHDSLTSLANQALFRDRVGHALTRAGRGNRRTAVLFLDVDNFKTVNDSLGHTAGDEVLVAVAQRLLATLRVSDTAARLGGDEFAILLEDLEVEGEALEVADRVLGALRKPFVAGTREVYVSASVGIVFDSGGMTADQLLRNADLAMYTAKREGKARYEIFEPAMHSAAVDRLEIENDLRRSLDRHELAIEYQPIVSFTTGRLTGMEALVRWHHPTRGLLPPSAFIALAEETGLIRELGRQVLTDACTQVRRWQSSHPGTEDLTLSVNLSPRQLHDGVIDHIIEALDVSGLPAANLVLEITESAMMQDADSTISKLVAIRSLGVRLAIDDFGTGYSSLGYLQRLPIDVLKIDRAFVAGSDDADGGQSDSQHPLPAAIVGLAHSLGLKAIAEGVETQDQADRLAGLGCDEAQGFHFHRPLKAAALDALLTREFPVSVPA